MYTDPPWGDGNLKYWQTINHRHTGQPTVQIDHATFVSRLFALARTHVAKRVFIEYGQRWRNEIISTGALFGFSSVATIQMLYRSGARFLPLDLHCFTRTHLEIPATHRANIQDSSGIDSVRNVLSPIAQRGQSVFDPCCGLGTTAKVAIELGLCFFGNELNSRRLDKTKKILEKATLANSA